MSLDKLKVKSSSLYWAHQLWKSKFRGKALKNQMNTDLKNVKSFRKNYRQTYKVLGIFFSWRIQKKKSFTFNETIKKILKNKNWGNWFTDYIAFHDVTWPRVVNTMKKCSLKRLKINFNNNKSHGVSASAIRQL